MMAVLRYREEVLLGTGGMAEVWRAVGPDGPVAIKRLLPHAARNPSLADAFEREGRLLSRIHHANVVAIREITRDERGPCLVLEYVEGSNLGAFPGPLLPRIALRIARDVLCALESVHGLCDDDGRPLGLIHRDLSPGNVLIGLDGKIKLTDFGIARAASGSQAKTTGQSIKGTLAYLSPEQARGAPIDARSDLFAAAALLYEMLAGVPIYDENDPRLALAMARAGDVKSLAAVRPELPISIVEFVDRALAASPADRFPNASRMRDELERVANTEGGLATDEEIAAWVRSHALPPPSADARILAPTAVGNRTRARLAAAAAAATLLVAALASWSLRGKGESAGSIAAPVGLAATAPSSNQVAGGMDAQPGDEMPAPARAVEVPAEPSAIPPASGARSVANVRPSRPGRTPPRAPTGPAAPRSPDEPGARPAETTTHPTRTSTPEKCLLDIGSEPAFAYVTIDGVAVGSTPLLNKEVAPGAHRIEVARDGLGSKSFTLEVRPGDRIRRVVKFP